MKPIRCVGEENLGAGGCSDISISRMGAKQHGKRKCFFKQRSDDRAPGILSNLLLQENTYNRLALNGDKISIAGLWVTHACGRRYWANDRHFSGSHYNIS